MSIPYAVVVYNPARSFNRKSSEVIVTRLGELHPVPKTPS